MYPSHRPLRDHAFRPSTHLRAGNRPLLSEPFAREFPWAVAAWAGFWTGVFVISIYVFVLPVIRGFATLVVWLS
jgi:hypothetical protein